MTGSPHKWRDVAWKRAIADGARDAIAYFMPDIAADMNTSREITGITGVELPVKNSDSDKGMLVSDIFLNVPVTGGEDWSVACLTEQQHQNDDWFAARMFDSVAGSGRRGRQAGTRASPYTPEIRKMSVRTRRRVTAWRSLLLACADRVI